MTTAEVIGIIVSIIGIIIAYIALKKDHYSEPSEELENLKLHFLMTKTLSEHVQTQLQDHILKHDAAEKLIFEGVTFGKYLQLMKENYDNSFNDERYNQLSHLKLTKPMIASVTQSLQSQFSALQQVQTLMKTL